MSLQLNKYDLIKQHLLIKRDNHQWLMSVREGHADSFPYRPVQDEKGKICGSVDATEYRPSQPCTTSPNISTDRRPMYLVNMPMRHLPGDDTDDRISALLHLFQEEAFGANATESAQEINRRFSLVVGINQIKSLDPNLNQAFISFISRIQKIETFANRIFGFFWIVQWTPPPTPSTYSLEKAFSLLKALDAEQAKNVRLTCEMPEGRLHPTILSQIPFQKIREQIKNSTATQTLFKHILDHSPPEIPIYYCVMDDDCQGLRTRVGLFSRMDEAIKTHGDPSAVSFGYSVSDSEPPLIRLGVTLDMRVRAAMTSAIPYSAYLPEPCTGFRIRGRGKTYPLNAFSFIGERRSLENRRFVENAVQRGLFDNSAVFIADGGVTTGTPGRMKTVSTGQVTTLTAGEIKKKSSLQAMRGIAQSHAFPKNWADNLYIALRMQGFKCPQVTDATQQLMHILGAYDPLSRITPVSLYGRYSTKIFDYIMTTYRQPPPEGLLNLRNTALGQLANLGMPRELIEKVDLAARNSGEAIFQFLQETNQRLSQAQKK